MQTKELKNLQESGKLLNELITIIRETINEFNWTQLEKISMTKSIEAKGDLTRALEKLYVLEKKRLQKEKIATPNIVVQVSCEESMEAFRRIGKVFDSLTEKQIDPNVLYK